MKRFARVVATAAAAALIVTAVTLDFPAEYSPSLVAADRTQSRIAVPETAGFSGATAARRLAGLTWRRTHNRTPRATAVKTASRRAAPAPTTEAGRAKLILAGLVAKYPILKGTTVEIGYAQGHQAICYYRSGRIVISPTHTATLERILNHEIWHVIDFRADGAINWGENLPPANATSFQG